MAIIHHEGPCPLDCETCDGTPIEAKHCGSAVCAGKRLAKHGDVCACRCPQCSLYIEVAYPGYRPPEHCREKACVISREANSPFRCECKCAMCSAYKAYLSQSVEDRRG